MYNRLDRSQADEDRANRLVSGVDYGAVPSTRHRELPVFVEMPVSF